MSPQNKRKHTTLTLLEKNEIVKKLENGARLVDLASEYGVGRATVYDIKKRGDKIKKFIAHREENVNSVRKTLKSGKFPQVEESLYSWYSQEREKNAAVSGEVLKEQARIFYRKIMKKDDFQASDGWLDKFKRRFGIRLSTSTGEKYNVAAVEHSDVYETVAEMDLSADQVYSARECGLFWRISPQQTSVPGDVPDARLTKDKITFMLCSNVSGTHKPNLLVIGEAENPRDFEDVTLPLVYRIDPQASITKSIFIEWFNEVFVPSVKIFLEENRLAQKALLLMDRCPRFPEIDILDSKDGSIRVRFSDGTPDFKPITNQDVFSQMKMHHKKYLSDKVLSGDHNVVQVLREINLRNVVFNLADAWEKISTETLVCSWRNLYPNLPILEIQHNSHNENSYPTQEGSSNEFYDSTNEANFDSDLIDLRNIIIEKLLDESVDLILDDYEHLLLNVKEEKCRFITHEEFIQDIQMKEEVDDDDQRNSIVPIRTISHNSAVDAFNNAIKWAEENGISTSDISTLKKLQAVALKMSIQ